MHLPTCPRRNNLYADCQCERIELNDHTAELQRFNENMQRLQDLQNENDELRSALATVTAERDKTKQDLDSMTQARNNYSELFQQQSRWHAHFAAEAEKLEESARKDGERLDTLQLWLCENFTRRITQPSKDWDWTLSQDLETVAEAKTLRSAIDQLAARLTSEGGR